MSLSLKGVREIFGRALKSKGTLAQMGQMRFAKELGELLPGSKIHLPGVGRETKAFQDASAYLTKRGFGIASDPGEAHVAMSLERGAFGHPVSTYRQTKQIGKPVIRASRVEPAYGPMEVADKHAKALTATDREIQYKNLYPEQKYASIDAPNPHAGAVAPDWSKIESIPLSARTRDRSARVGGRRASDTRALEQAELREARGQDVWGDTIDTRRNPIQQDIAFRKNQNLRRNVELVTSRSFAPIPGRPTSNTNPIGGRIEGMPEGWFAKFRKLIGFGSPWRGLIGMSKYITKAHDKLGINALGRTLMGSAESPASREALRRLKTIVLPKPHPKIRLTARDAFYAKRTRSEVASYIKDLRTSERSGFRQPIVIRHDHDKQVQKMFDKERVALGLPTGTADRNWTNKELRRTIAHERVHQIRIMKNEFKFIGAEEKTGLTSTVHDWLGQHYSRSNFVEEAMAWGDSFSYMNRGVGETGSLLHTRGEGLKANVLMAHAAKQAGTSHNIAPFIQKRPSKLGPMVQADTIRTIENVQKAQTHSTVAGIASSLHSDRGIRGGRLGGNG